MTVERLAKGRAFHDTVQTAFLTDLAHATGFRERGWRLLAGGRGRVDLAVVTDDREKMLIIIEIRAPTGTRSERTGSNGMSSAISANCWPISILRLTSLKTGSGRASPVPCFILPVRPAQRAWPTALKFPEL